MGAAEPQEDAMASGPRAPPGGIPALVVYGSRASDRAVSGAAPVRACRGARMAWLPLVFTPSLGPAPGCSRCVCTRLGVLAADSGMLVHRTIFHSAAKLTYASTQSVRSCVIHPSRRAASSLWRRGVCGSGDWRQAAAPWAAAGRRRGRADLTCEAWLWCPRGGGPDTAARSRGRRCGCGGGARDSVHAAAPACGWPVCWEQGMRRDACLRRNPRCLRARGVHCIMRSAGGLAHADSFHAGHIWPWRCHSVRVAHGQRDPRVSSSGVFGIPNRPL